MQETINKWLLRTFIIAWSLWVFTDYLMHMPIYNQAIAQFPYWGMLAIILTLCGGLGYYFLLNKKVKQPKKKKVVAEPKQLRGWQIYLFLLLLSLIVVAFYGVQNNLFDQSPLFHLGYYLCFSLLLHLALLYLIIVGFSIGKQVVRYLPISGSTGTLNIFSIAIGWSILGWLLVILGQFHVLYPYVLWPLTILPIILNRKAVLAFLKTLFKSPIPVIEKNKLELLAPILLLIAIAINLTGAMKVFATGFDGTAQYMNTVGLISDYHGLPSGGKAANWSLFISLGKTLFGSMTLSIMIAHLSGVLVCWCIYYVARQFIASRMAWVAATIFYLTPFATYHNVIDEKIDLGYLFYSLTIILLCLVYYKNRTAKAFVNIGSRQVPADLVIWATIGWLTGFAFGIKYLAFVLIVSIVAYGAYMLRGQKGFAGALLSMLAFIFLLRLYEFSSFNFSTETVYSSFVLFFVPGVTLLFLAFRKHWSDFGKWIIQSAVFGAFLLLCFAPWMIKHLSENQSFSVKSILQGVSEEGARIDYLQYIGQKEETIPFRQHQEWLSIDHKVNKILPDYSAPPQVLLTQNDGTQRQSHLEEVRRYLGYENGLPLFLSIPYDMSTSINIRFLRFTDIGFLLLVFLPLLFLSIGEKSLVRNIGFLLFFFSVIAISLNAAHLQQINNLDYNAAFAAWLPYHPSGIQYTIQPLHQLFWVLWSGVILVTQPLYDATAQFNYTGIFAALLVISGVLWWFAYPKVKPLDAGVKQVLVFSLGYGTLWGLFGSGIAYYGFTMFALLMILPIYFWVNPELLFGQKNQVFVKRFLSVVGITVLGLYTLLQFTNPNNKVAENASLYAAPFFKAATNPSSFNDVLDSYNPFYKNTLPLLNENEKEYIYRAGTFLNPFIRKNDQRVFIDNQLEVFSVMKDVYDERDGFFKLLKANGFKYILYDLGTASLDQTSDGSLTKKANEFVQLLLNSGDIKLVATDNLVEDTQNILRLPQGNFNARADLVGKTIRQGSFVLFEIL